MNKVYLGDSVYAEINNAEQIVLTTEGYGATNTIYLEPEVYFALVKYVDNIIKKTVEE